MKVSRKLRISLSNKWIFFCQTLIFITLIIINISIAHADDRPIIVIDPGHGGTDSGATGYYKSVEKNITLTLAKRIALQMNDHYEIILTRKTDTYVPLIERTAIANNAQAIALISLHVGASFRLYPHGIRTYYWQSEQGENFFNQMNDENQTHFGNQPLLWDNIQRYHLNSSKLLAKCIHTSILSQINMLDRQIAGAPLFVLTGADMAAILIEIEFISRPKSENNLLRIPYMDKIARGISLGMDQFLKKIEFDSKRSLHF